MLQIEQDKQRILYDDGSIEDVELAKEKWQLLPPKKSETSTEEETSLQMVEAPAPKPHEPSPTLVQSRPPVRLCLPSSCRR